MLIENCSNPVCCVLCKKKKNNCSGVWQFWKGFFFFFFENKKQHSQLLLLLFYALSFILWHTGYKFQPLCSNNSVKSQFLLLKWHMCPFFHESFVLGDHNASHQHRLTALPQQLRCSFFPHKVHFEQQVKACHQLYVASTLSLPLFLSACYHFVFLTHTRTHTHKRSCFSFNQSDEAGAESYLTGLHVIN